VLRSYRQVFRIRGLSLPLLASFAGSLPIGMLSLSVLLLVRLHGQSIGAAALAAGALNLGSGAGLVAQGAWIDRRGPSRVLAAAGLTCAASLAALAAAVAVGCPAWLTAALAFAGGACIPAIPTAVRALCATLVADQQLRLTAYAMLAMASTTAAILGPLLVSVLLAGGAAAAVLVTAVLAAATGVLYALAPAARRQVPPVRAPRWRPRSLAVPGMRTLAVASAANGAVLGILSVAVPALALSRHAPALAGELSAVCAAGDLAGGVAYGGRSWPLPLRARLVAALLALAASCAALSAVLGDTPAVAAGMAVFGAAEAVTGITLTALIQHVAPHGARTESYSVIISAALAGTAAGDLAGGALIAGAGARLAFMAAAGAAVAAAAWAASRKGTLREQEGTGRPGGTADPAGLPSRVPRASRTCERVASRSCATRRSQAFSTGWRLAAPRQAAVPPVRCTPRRPPRCWRWWPGSAMAHGMTPRWSAGSGRRQMAWRRRRSNSRRPTRPRSRRSWTPTSSPGTPPSRRPPGPRPSPRPSAAPRGRRPT
jgi:MFS family permease